MLKVALTGSTGMIGRHMKCLLESKGIECVNINRKKWNLEEWKNLAELDNLFDKAEAVFHFGATLPEQDLSGIVENSQTQKIFDANIKSCLNLAEWAQLRNVPVVYLSGATVYKNPNANLIKEDAPRVINGLGGFYGFSKLMAEMLFEHYVAQGLKLIILRPSSVYGHGLAYDKLITKNLRLAEEDKTIEISNGENRINLIHALDVSRAALNAVNAKAWGTYNISGLTSPSIFELVEFITAVCGGGKIKTENKVNKEKFLRFDLDSTKAQIAFSFNPAIGIEQGLIMMLKNRLM